MTNRNWSAYRGGAAPAGRRLWTRLASGWAAAALIAVGAHAQDAPVDFAKDIEPILKERCYSCHGAEKQKGELRLDSIEAILKGGENGPSVVAGKPGESPLCLRVSLPAGHDDIMPPKGDPLTDAQKGLIAKWIEQGAVVTAAAPAPAPEAPAPAPAPEAKSNEQLASELYVAQVRPILEARCYSCHGPEKQKEDLRLDYGEAILKGGEHGPVVVPGKPAESKLCQLISLPADNTDIMPPKGDPLKPEEIAAIAKWIELGASVPAEFAAAPAAPAPAPAPEAAPAAPAAAGQPSGVALLDELAKAVQPAPQEAIDALRKTGVLVLPIDMKSPLLQVNFQVAGGETGDEQIAAIATLADQITWLNLAGTKITDAGLAHVAKLKNLTSLHLEKTAVTDAGMEQLKGLSNLEYLNLYATQVGDAGIAQLAGLARLQKLYLWNSKATKAGVDALHASLPSVLVNMGYEDKPAEAAPAATPAEAPAPEAAPAAVNLAALFTKDSCCFKANAGAAKCDHPCCVEAAAKGEVCEKCNAGAAAKKALVAKFVADSCCAKEFAAGKDCAHPCCVEALAKGEVCAKCNPAPAPAEAPAPEPAPAVNLAALFSKDGCCAKANAGALKCDHPCCVEAAAKGEVCEKCNAGAAAKKALVAKFGADSCCAKEFAAGKDCAHPCCAEALAKGEVCTKCNPGAANSAAPEKKDAKSEADKVASASRPLLYNRDIRPILADNCFTCHGPDKNSRKAGLRLDVRAEAIFAKDGHAAIVPGDIASSELIKRLNAHGTDDLMPPAESNKTLTPAQIETLTKWVEQGAEYQPHWAFITPQRPEAPAVSDATWVKNPIDAFILARLDHDGIKPSPEADRVSAIRRLSFDIIGLPPTPAEIDAYVNDTAPDAYDKLVERLLASAHFGERMAMDWLDLVRYADTNGFHGDEYRSVWPYRDYVVNAFNENKPFDQFTIEQLGGDLLPNPTREQRIAATYNRLNQLTAEGGAQPKEYEAIYSADRVRTASTAWLGTTMACAQCHDHKFDPFTTKDFYSFAAFFADIDEKAVFGSGQNWDPILQLPTPEQELRRKELDTALAQAETTLATHTPELEAAQAAWEDSMRALVDTVQNDWTIVRPTNPQSANGATLAVQPDSSVLASGADPDKDIYTLTIPVNQRNITGLRLEAIAKPELGGKLSRANGNFVLTGLNVTAKSSGAADATPIKLASAEADFSQDKFPIASILDDKRNTGWAVSGHEILNTNRAAAIRFAEPVAGGPGSSLTVELKFESDFAQHAMACFRLAITTVDQPTLGPTGLGVALYTILTKDRATRTPEEHTQLATHFRGVAPELAPVRELAARLKGDRDALEKSIPFVLATVSIEPRTVRVLARGNWMDESGEVVAPNTPSFLPALNVTERRPTRLDLAKWLVAPENPLTSRVYMNHLWKQFFGMGLSKSLEDIGTQGEWPTHPELLDWLAVEFRESGWDVKHMIRTMVTSATYRQSSVIREDIQKVDPYNRLLARQGRFRLQAEMVRDTALRISGLLAERIGGPTVKPYQPDGYYADTNTFTGPLLYDASKGEDQYRRGLYTFWKRSFLHPSMLAFDAPSREECTADRTASNTPLQALVLLNDPTYVEAARVFAERIMREGGPDAASRLAWAYRIALGRTPSEAEASVLTALCQKHLTEYQQDKTIAAKVLSAGFAPVPQDLDAAELAAWTSVARTILNLHETITRS